MTKSILVAYATQHGSTRDVAQVIATTLREHGLPVELQPVHQVQHLDRYDAVILGAPFYMGKWLRDAHRFLKHHRATLSRLPVAIFALGPRSEAYEEVQEVRTQLDKALAGAPWVTPVAIEVFGGKIDPASLHFPFNHMPAVDARNWTAIRAYAERLVEIFRPADSPISQEASR